MKREQAKSREDALAQLVDHVKSPHATPIHIFPEGCCVNGSCMLSFHRGAFVPGLPLQPALIKYPFKHFDMSAGKGQVTALYWIRMLCQFVNSMYYKIGMVRMCTPQKGHSQAYHQLIRFQYHVRNGNSVLSCLVSIKNWKEGPSYICKERKTMYLVTLRRRAY